LKFNFKIQEYQTNAVNAVVEVFKGQKLNNIKYRIDLGNEKHIIDKQIEIDGQVKIDNYNNLKGKDEFGEIIYEDSDIGYKNDEIILSDEDLLKNINEIQNLKNIKSSKELIKDLGRCNIDIDMETGTGKTYVYIKTMYELNKKYGWSKFIVVVPSIAIREGVKKSFEITQEHFMEEYKKKVRFFIYYSSNLGKIDDFSKSNMINVMIINTQAFTSSLKEDAKNKTSRIIYSKRDEFQSRRPIDVISTNRPIIILDEPQKMGGEATQKAIKNFNPLFTINYSATHKKENNKVYVLDALEAYNQKLVKKIEVKGFEIKNFRGTYKYLYLENIEVTNKNPPKAKVELEINYKKSINRETRMLNVGDNLYNLSKKMEQYKGYIISEIDPIESSITFTNGDKIIKGNVVGDMSEQDLRRIQIRETIISHFEKEEMLFNKGIKSLSLFFIDEVSKYRKYDNNGDEILGEYGKIFEQEYKNILDEKMTKENNSYQKYLKEMCIDVNTIHNGYFSIDKSGKIINSKAKRDSLSDDISAYDLILKNKERLLSFEEPTRFIFSHSALREGWDNPNVFQICTLKHSDSQTVKRQEVGRGLRLCVDKDGNRMDKEMCGEMIHDINKLTVIASESYKSFVTDLQNDIKKDLYNRPAKATIEYFEGKTIIINGEAVKINQIQAKAINRYLIKNDYIDENDNITNSYRIDIENNCIAPLPENLQYITDEVHKIIQEIFDESILNNMIEDANKTKITKNSLNGNFYKKEFQTLWEYINHKYSYTVKFASEELINNSIKYIDEKLFVPKLQYMRTTASQKEIMKRKEIDNGTSFDRTSTQTKLLHHAETSSIKYDILGKIAEGATLTRVTVAKILKGISENKFEMFKINPEEFIKKIIKIIIEQKATAIVEHISYDKVGEKYDNDIFTIENHSQNFDKAFEAQKHIQNYVFTDGIAKESIESKFATALESSDEVCVYAKLPRGFQIPTPVGNYSPDWAIAFYEGKVKHIYFIAETKGTMDSLNLRPIEQVKIRCAKKLFNEISTDKVRYHEIDSYQNLLNIMDSII